MYLYYSVAAHRRSYVGTDFKNLRANIRGKRKAPPNLTKKEYTIDFLFRIALLYTPSERK